MVLHILLDICQVIFIHFIYLQPYFKIIFSYAWKELIKDYPEVGREVTVWLAGGPKDATPVESYSGSRSGWRISLSSSGCRDFS